MKFAPLFQDHAVLQRNISLPIWGVAAPGETVMVSLGSVNAGVLSGADGRWLVRFAALPAGGPYELKAEAASGHAVVRDILIGDVWICSGQSNMGWLMNQTDATERPEIIPDAPEMRLLMVSNTANLGQHQEAIEGQWAVATTQEQLTFSAVGGWFGRELHRELGVPIGLICTAWGGTRIQAWISREALMLDPIGRVTVESYEADLFDPEAAKVETYASMSDWERRGAPKDTGNAGLENSWHSPSFDDSGWKTMSLPAPWQERGHPGSGIFWFRHKIAVPAEWSGQDLELHLGKLDKHDDTWVNGERVGGLSWEAGPNAWCTPRIYVVPARLIGKDRSLVVASRVRSHVYNGGFLGPHTKMRIVPVEAPGAAAISLVGEWRYAIEQDWGVIQPTLGGKLGLGNPNSPYILFDSRVTPLIPYGVRGIIWYQGESNASEAPLYRRLMRLMIRDWRRAWGQGDIPFLQVQLANYQAAAVEPGPSDWAELREAQTAALSEPHVGMAVAIDVGEALDIHPRDKRSVGLRLARWAMAEVYGRGGVPSGPLYKNFSREAEGILRIHFCHAAGLRTRDGQPLLHIAIAGANRAFVWAQSRIEGETLVVWHPDIASPAAVRYAWSGNPEGCNLVNAEDLPASPFRTDDWPR